MQIIIAVTWYVWYCQFMQRSDEFISPIQSRELVHTPNNVISITPDQKNTLKKKIITFRLFKSPLDFLQ